MTADPLTILLRHNHWANGVMLDRCEQLSPEQFHRNFEIGPGNLHDVMHHIVGCVERWMQRIKGELTPLPVGPFSVGQLRLRNDAATTALETLIRELELAGLMDAERTTEFTGEDGGTIVFRFNPATAITHMLVHGTHHRAQALNMLRRLGVPTPLPELDVTDWLYETEQKR